MTAHVATGRLTSRSSRRSPSGILASTILHGVRAALSAGSVGQPTLRLPSPCAELTRSRLNRRISRARTWCGRASRPPNSKSGVTPFNSTLHRTPIARRLSECGTLSPAIGAGARQDVGRREQRVHFECEKHAAPCGIGGSHSARSARAEPPYLVPTIN